MMTIFQCQQCLKAFAVNAIFHVKVYEEQGLCMMCKKTNGQNKFTPEEKICLFAEEKVSEEKKAINRSHSLPWSS